MAIRRSLKRTGIAVVVVVVAVGLACLALTAGCGTEEGAGDEGSSGTPSKGVVKLGLLATLTGQFASDGEDMVRGAELAAEELNAAGGVEGYTFEIVTVDMGAQTADAVASGIRKMVDQDKVDAIMEGYGSTTHFEINTMAELDMPFMSGGGAAATTRIIGNDGRTKFPTCYSTAPDYEGYETEPPLLVEKWISEGKVDITKRRLAIVSSDNDYSNTIAAGLKKNFEALGWTTVVFETVPFGIVNDWRAIIAKIRAAEPDFVVNTDYTVANDATFLKQLMASPIDALVFLQYAPSVPEFIELTKDKSTGVLFDVIGAPIFSPDNQANVEFQEKWQTKYGGEAGVYGATLYESVRIYAEALKKSGGDPKDHLAVGTAIADVTFTSPRGVLAFDPTTNMAKTGENFIPCQIYQLWDGERVLLTPEVFATGEFRLPPWMTE